MDSSVDSSIHREISEASNEDSRVPEEAFGDPYVGGLDIQERLLSYLPWVLQAPRISLVSGPGGPHGGSSAAKPLSLDLRYTRKTGQVYTPYKSTLNL